MSCEWVLATRYQGSSSARRQKSFYFSLKQQLIIHEIFRDPKNACLENVEGVQSVPHAVCIWQYKYVIITLLAILHTDVCFIILYFYDRCFKKLLKLE